MLCDRSGECSPERSVVEIRDWPEQKSSLESSEELKSNDTTLVRKTG